MKVIGVCNNYRVQDQVDNEFPAVYLMADSTLLKDGKPFFIPDFSQDIRFHTSIVVKINRLGKNISSRFAHRYYDEITIGLTLKAEDIAKKYSELGLPSDIATSFDGAAILGEFINKDEIENLDNISYSLSINEDERLMGRSNDLILKIDELIEYISKYFTLKIGDILYTGYNSISLPIEMNQKISATLNGKVVLDFKTK